MNYLLSDMEYAQICVQYIQNYQYKLYIINIIN